VGDVAARHANSVIGLAARCGECLETGQGRLLIGPQVANLPHNRRIDRSAIPNNWSALTPQPLPIPLSWDLQAARRATVDCGSAAAQNRSALQPAGGRI